MVFNLKNKENIIKKHLKQKSNKKSKIGLQEINHLLNNHPPQSWPLIDWIRNNSILDLDFLYEFCFNILYKTCHNSKILSTYQFFISPLFLFSFIFFKFFFHDHKKLFTLKSLAIMFISISHKQTKRGPRLPFKNGMGALFWVNKEGFWYTLEQNTKVSS